MSDRDRTICMLRIKNEARWIQRCMERTFEVCSKIIILDDGSTDGTIEACRNATWSNSAPFDNSVTPYGWGYIYRGVGLEGPRELHVLPSPFTYTNRQLLRANELRDKNYLWWYSVLLDWDFCLCLDGDEMLSRKAIREFSNLINLMRTQYDIIHIPFVYLWDSETQQRCDGIYGGTDADVKTLRFPRLFTILRVPELQLFDMRFTWLGSHGLHCGSIPQSDFRPNNVDATSVFYRAPVVHFGYIDNNIRQSKFEFYNRIDPNNIGEGYYKHIIGEPDQHAPGPVETCEWNDV
jgi:O-antigen biosynthesis protein